MLSVGRTRNSYVPHQLLASEEAKSTLRNGPANAVLLVLRSVLRPAMHWHIPHRKGFKTFCETVPSVDVLACCQGGRTGASERK